MNLREAERVIIRNVDVGISTKLKSAPGRGKSEMAEDLVAKLTKRDGFPWGYATAFLATYTAPDLIGYQFKGERPWGPNGEMVAVTEPTMPLWMITTDGKPLHYYKRGILVLEEYGQGESDVKRGSAQLLLNGEIGQWRVPNFGNGGWGVVALTNRYGVDRSGVTKDFDFVINRTMELDVTDDPKAWEYWAVNKGIPPIFISFAMQYPHLVWTADVPEKQGPWTTPRSFIKSARYMIDAAKDNGGKYPEDATNVEAITGMMGIGTTSQLFSHIKLELELPSIDEVARNALGLPLPDKADLRMLQVYSYSHKVDSNNIGPVLQYIARLGKEFTMTFLRTACLRDSKLLYAPAVTKWSKENTALMVQVTQSLK